jgi:hypothetical protein
VQFQNGDVAPAGNSKPNFSLDHWTPFDVAVLALLAIIAFALLIRLRRPVVEATPGYAAGFAPQTIAPAPPALVPLLPGQERQIVNPVVGTCEGANGCLIKHTVTADGRCPECAPEDRTMENPPPLDPATGHCAGCPFFTNGRLGRR